MDIVIGIVSSFGTIEIAVDIASRRFGYRCCSRQTIGPAVELLQDRRFLSILNHWQARPT